MVIVSDAIVLLAHCPDRPHVVAIGGCLQVKPGLMLSLVGVKLSAVALVASPKYCQSMLRDRIGLCIVEWLS